MLQAGKGPDSLPTTLLVKDFILNQGKRILLIHQRTKGEYLCQKEKKANKQTKTGLLNWVKCFKLVALLYFFQISSEENLLL
jgi:hypothetical protein